MDANKALELATIAFPNDTEMRSVYMLGLDKGYELCKEQMMKETEKPCHTVDEWMEHIKNADALTKAIFSNGPYNVLYDALNHPYRDCYDAIKEFGELCYQTARQDMMKDAVVCEAEVCKLADRVWVTPTDNKKFHQDTYDNFKAGDKVRVIIVKEDKL